MKKANKITLSLFLCLLVIISTLLPNETTRIETNSNQNLLAANLETRATTRSLKNIAVFIKFADSDANVVHHLDDEQSVENAKIIYNSDELFEMDTVKGKILVPSVKKYYERESYGNLSLTTEFFPKVDGKVVSYTDSHPIGYYLKYNEQNQIGYKNETESLKRETELVNNAVAYIANEVTVSGITSTELDTDNNGIIDAISFIIEGQKDLPSSISWRDLLWSHKRDNTGVTEKLLGKNVVAYNLIYANDYTEAASLFSLNRGTYGTIIHEFGHTLGYMDLYRYETPSSKPVGFYDIMGNSIGSNPQGFLTYYVSNYNSETNWHNPLPVITKTTKNITVYRPKFIDKNEQRAIKIQIDGNDKEYFVVEYHEKMNTYETYSADASGIIIYRVNENNKYQGNNGTSDHVYVFRPNETNLGDAKGDLSSATLNINRRVFGKDLDLNNKSFDNETIFFSDGSNSGIKIEVTGQTDNSIMFNVRFPEMDGDGTKANPYLIGDTNTFLYLMTQNTKNKYYKITSDLDFKNVTDYPIINFEGNLEGNNKTIRNITTNGSGIFNSVGNYTTHTKIENLQFENITAYSTKENYLGGFTGSAENITLNNIHLKDGTVTKEGNSLNGIVSTGGFAGNVSNNVTITNCSTNLNVSAPKNVGGFIGLNQNATIKNSFSSGNVVGNNNVGGFIGLQAINDNKYNTPENVYYKRKENQNLLGVGNYAPGFHNLNTLNASSLSAGIRSITIKDTINVSKNSKTTLPITVNPNANLTYTVRVENSKIAKYENSKLVALNEGTTTIYTDITIGSAKMTLASKLIVNKNSAPTITEEDILNYLGLTKKGIYITGFAVGTDVSTVKSKINNYDGVTLKSFKTSTKNEINKGRIATGMEFTLSFNNTEITYTVVIKGDVNGDGLIYATDYVKIKNHIMGKSTLGGAYLLAADVNNGGNIYATDYVKIKNYIMEKGTIEQTFNKK